MTPNAELSGARFLRVRLDAVLDGGAHTIHDAHRNRGPTLDHPDGATLELACTRNEAVTLVLPQAERQHAALTPTEVALVLVRATRCILRRATPEMKSANRPLTPEFSGARSASAGMSC